MMNAGVRDLTGAPDEYALGNRPKLRTRKTQFGNNSIVIRTSDSISFKKCRRSWAWSSHLMNNLGSRNLATPLWFGSGIHWALEDFHGKKLFKSAADAFAAYCIATSKQNLRELPHDAQEKYKLGKAMMDYYEFKWLSIRQPHKTYVENGVLQTEVDFQIPVPLDQYPHLARMAAYHGADSIVYSGTMDGVAIDEHGRLWIVEYKTAARAEHYHYMTDPQVTRYVWAARQIYDKPIAGVIYMQFVKKEAEQPRILSSGKVSTASNQVTSVPLYQEVLTNMYGDLSIAPKDNLAYLEELKMKEDEHRDAYIQRVLVERNSHSTIAEAQAILLELEDMLDPNLALYPNPTRECSRMCSFLGPCVSFSDGGDWENNLRTNFAERDQAPDKYWRKRMPSPETMEVLRQQHLEPDLTEVQLRLESMDPAEREAIIKGEQDVEFSFDS